MSLVEAPQQQARTLSTYVRATAAVLIVLSWLSMLATAGQKASLELLVSDVQKGRTQHVLVVGDRAVWRDGALRSREIELRGARIAFDKAEVGDARTLSDLLRRYGARGDVVREAPWFADPRLPLAAGGVLAFLLLLGGPDPWRFNRWGWFWLLFVGKGIGLGAVGFLLLSTSRPWRRARAGLPRGGGWSGWGWSLALNLLFILLALGLRQLVLPELHSSASWTSPG